jgi:lipooligosaccharide transport system permease protein
MYSAFSRMHVQKTWEGILNAPVALDDIVFAEMLWAGLKSLFSAIAIALVLVALDISREPTLVAALPVLFLTGITFSSVALVFNAMARSYDFFTYYFTLVLTPMTFLSGVYFPTEHMPAWLQSVGAVLPLTAAVELVRPLVIGEWPAQWARPLAVLGAYAAAGYWIALVLTRRRFFR